MLANINHKKSYCPGANMIISQQMEEVVEDSVRIQRAEKGNRETSMMFSTADFLHCSVYSKDVEVLEVFIAECY